MPTPPHQQEYTVNKACKYSADGEILITVLDRSEKEIEVSPGCHEISAEAFRACSQLQTVRLPEGLKIIRQGAFRDCLQLKEINLPTTLREIEKRAFQNCALLRELYLPEGLTKVGSRAFKDCFNLVIFHLPLSLTEIGKFAFYGFPSLIKIRPYNHIKAILRFLFCRYTNMMHLCIPNGSVSHFSSLGLPFFLLVEMPKPEVEAPKRTKEYNDDGTILYEVLDKSVQSYTVREGCLAIRSEAFLGCEKLVKVVLPESLKMLGNYAFKRCKYLPTITLPGAMTYVGKHLFIECPSIRRVYVPTGKLEEYLKKGAPDDLAVEIGPQCMPVHNDPYCEYSPDGETLLWVHDRNRRECVVKEGCKKIDPEAFRDAEELAEIYLPEGLEEIGYWAFKNCFSLRKIVIPSSVERFGEWVFYQCYALEEVVVSKDKAHLFTNLGILKDVLVAVDDETLRKQLQFNMISEK